MSICSLVVYSKLENVPLVEKQISTLEGVEINADSGDGRLVVSIDHPDRTHCSKMIMDMSAMKGVLNTSLIYEYYE